MKIVYCELSKNREEEGKRVTAKERLQSVAILDAKIDNLGKERDKIQKAIEEEEDTRKLEEIKRRVSKTREQYIEERERIIADIHKLNNPTYIKLLYARYIESDTMEKVAVKIHYSWRQTNNLHSEALQAFERITNHINIA